jgi:hypothetical protein
MAGIGAESERVSIALLHRIVQPLKAALALFAFLVLYPLRYHAVEFHFDGLWMAALNYLHTAGVIFGKDIEFTYGPFAYLTLPMPFGTNLEQGIVFQLASWLVFGALLAWLIFRKHTPLINIVIFAICAPAGAQLFRAGPSDGPDYFLEMLVVMLAAASLIGPSVLYFAAVAIASFLLLIKLSSGIATIGVVLLFPLVLALTDRSRALRLLCIGAIEVSILVPVLFFATGGTASALVRYFRAGLEISAGYSAAMSLVGPSDAIWAALILLVGFAALSAGLFVKRDRAFPVSIAVLPLLFLEFKHSFVRQDGHVEILFRIAPFVLAATLLFADLSLPSLRNVRVRALCLIAFALIFSPWLYFERGHYYYQDSFWEESPFVRVARIADLTHFAAVKQRLAQESEATLGRGRFPPQLRERIGNHSVAIFPMNVAYAAVNPTRFVYFPVLQAYSAYTPYLDAWDAEFLNDPQRRPDLIVFEWVALDERHPLLDCPQTARALYENYEFDSLYGKVMLLRLRRQALPSTVRYARRMTMTIGQPLSVGKERDSVIRILLKYTLSGRLADFFFRIPPIYATLSGPNGRSMMHRIPHAVLAGGIAMRLMPADLEDARRLFETGRTATEFDTIAISGPGAEYLERFARVDVYEGQAGPTNGQE